MEQTTGHNRTVKISLKRNFLMNMVLTMSAFLFPLITFPYASRVLHPEGMGKIAFATSLISYFDMIAQLGIPVYGIRTCAKVRDDRAALSGIVRELLLMNLAFCLFSYLLFGCSLLWIPRLKGERKLYLIMSISILCNSIGMEWLYKAMEKYTYITLRSLFCKLISIIALFWLVQAPEDYLIYGFIVIFAGSASNIINMLTAGRYVDLHMTPENIRNTGRHLRSVLVFFAMSCATIVYTNLDTLMLGFMKSDAEVGFYNAAVKIKVVLISMVTALGAVLLPRLSYYMENGKMQEVTRICRKAMSFVFLFSFPLCVYFILYAEPSIRLLSGPGYEPAVLPMQIIMPTLILVGITNILGIQILVPLGREKSVLISELGGASADLVINWLLIPRYGAAGAALGTLIAEAVVLVIQAYTLKDMIGDLNKNVSWRTVITGTALGAIISVIVVRRTTLESFGILFVSAILFFGFYGTFLLITGEPLMKEVLAGIPRKNSKD